MKRDALPCLRRALATAAVLAVLGFVRPAAASSTALDLVKSAQVLEQAHEEDLALRRYMEALSLDVTCEEAYLGLGSLRARRGDLHEAERVYSVALEHVPALRAARIARAYVRRQLGARAEAEQDVLAGSEDEIAALRILATWQAEDGQTPAQLAIWRKIATRAEAAHDPTLLREARTMVRALAILLGPADPVSAPPDAQGVRRSLSVLARRGGT